jgi:hypothetical protein
MKLIKYVCLMLIVCLGLCMGNYRNIKVLCIGKNSMIDFGICMMLKVIWNCIEIMESYLCDENDDYCCNERIDKSCSSNSGHTSISKSILV